MINYQIVLNEKKEQQFSLKEKIFIVKFKFRFMLNYLKLVDNEFRCYLKSIKYFIWLSWFYLAFDLIIKIIGYYL